jgi:hypothetical protein
VNNCVLTLNGTKSTGFDKISTYTLLKVNHFIISPVTKIINKSFSKILPICKSDNDNECTHYRPISILPAFSKVFKQVMLKSLTKFVDKPNILHDSQHGFRNKHSRLPVATAVVNTLTNALDSKNLP